jgi:hypothetical protein
MCTPLPQARDPGRTFVLGERLSYVLLAGARLQDEAAEDPLTAALAHAPPDLELCAAPRLGHFVDLTLYCIVSYFFG